MTVQHTATNARVERVLATATAASRMAGEEPTAQDIAAARRMLLGETTIDDELRSGRAELEERFGLSR